MANKKVLIIDDSFDITRVLKSAIYTINPEIDVFVTPSAEEAMLEISRGNLDLIITDIRLPGISGLELLRKIRSQHPNVNIVMMSGITDQDIEEKAIEAGANIFLKKPIEMPVFLDTIGSFLGYEAVKEENKPSFIADIDILEDEEYEANLAIAITNLKKEVLASHVWLLNEIGQVTAQSGEQTVPEFETKWAPLIMPIMSASESFTQHVEGKRPERAVLSFGIKNFNLFIAPISDYTLVVLVAAGRGTQRIPLVVDVMLEFQQEILQILNRMGLIPAKLELVKEDDEEIFSQEIIKEEGDDDIFKAVLETKTASPVVDKFWNEADIAKAYDLNNPEILSFDQAAKLGLAPENDEEE